MALKYPIQYELNTERMKRGVRWTTLTLKNVGEEVLRNLDVRLNSLDTYAIHIYGTGRFIPTLQPDEEREIFFQFGVDGTGGVYVTMDGRKEGEPFHWESPAIPVLAGEAPAELVGLFTLAEPPASLGEPIEVEAILRGLRISSGLVLEFWVETPKGTFESPEKVGVGTLDAEEETRFTATFTPDEEGIYTLHAYLYEGQRRIDHLVEYLSVSL